MSLTQCLSKRGLHLYEYIPSMEGAVITAGITRRD